MAAEVRTRGLRRWLRRIVAVLVATGVLLLLMEGACRLAGYRGMERFCADPVLGFALHPDQAVQDLSTLQPVRINGLGLRGEEPAAAPAQLRVACFGDSVTFGRGVLDDQTYPALLQHELALQHPGTTVEVRNLGVPGYGLIHARAWLEQRSSSFPGQVWVVAQTWNNHWLPGTPEELAALADEIGPGLHVRNRLKRLALFHWAMRTWLSLGLFPLYDAFRERVYGADLPQDAALASFDDNLDRIAILAAERSALLVLLRVPPDAGFDAAFLDHGGELAAARPQQVALVDMGPRFDRAGPRAYWVASFDPHPDAAGHRAIADALLEELAGREGLFKGSGDDAPAAPSTPPDTPRPRTP